MIDEKLLEEQQREREDLIKRCDKIFERALEIRNRHSVRMYSAQKRIDRLIRKKDKLEAYQAQAALKLEAGKLYVQESWCNTELFYVDRLTKTGLPVGRHIAAIVRADKHLPLKLFSVSVKMYSRSEMRYNFKDHRLYEGSQLTALITQGVVMDRFLELTANMKKRGEHKYILAQKDNAPVDVTDVKIKAITLWSKEPTELDLSSAMLEEHYHETMLEQLRARGFNV